MEKYVTYSREPYEGYVSVEIKAADEKIHEMKKEIKRLEESVYNLRSRCIHEYMFSSMGMYEDNYRCRICGEESER